MKKIIPVFALLYIPILLLSFYLFYVHKNKQLEILSSAQTKESIIKKDLLIDQCFALIHDVNYWSKIRYPNEFEPYGKDTTFLKPYVELIKGITNYDQFRFINLEGKELFRAERNGTNSLKLGELQDKNNRFYVKEGLKLEPGQIYVSTITLNIENGKIEVPYKPVLRVVGPIFDQNNEMLGIVVINFRMGKILDLIKNRLVDNNISLVDSTNKIITSTLYKEDLPSEIPSLKIETAAAFYFPFMNIERDTTFMAKGSIWTIKNIDLNNSRLKNDLIGKDFLEIKSPVNWKLFMQIPKEMINDNLSTFYQSIVTFNAFAILALLAVTIVFQKNRIQKEKFYDELEIKNARLSRKRNLLQKNNIEISEINHRLETRNKQLSEFNYMVSHNLRAPVTSMSVIVEMIKNEKELEKINFLLPKLEQVFKSIIDFTHDIGDYVSLLDEKNITLEDVNLKKLLDQVKNELSGTLLDASEFEILVDLKAWTHVKFSKFYLHSVFQNLISNAIKYRRNDVRSFILFKTGMENEGKVLLVKDNGVGINLKRHGENVFKLYKRFHRNISGKGIGLFLVKSQLEALDATISIESKENLGTEFKINFNAL